MLIVGICAHPECRALTAVRPGHAAPNRPEIYTLTDFHGRKLKQVDFKRVVRAVWVSATGTLVDPKEANSDVTQPGWTSCHHS